VIVRTLTENDWYQWESLWQMSVGGVLTPDILSHSFETIIDKNASIKALVAENDNKHIVGLLHYVVHPVAGCIEPVCYMQDLFVSPDNRRQGIAKTLMQELKKIASSKKYDRIYWLLDKSNEGAKEFYKNIGVPLEFGLYIIPVGMRERLHIPEIKTA